MGHTRKPRAKPGAAIEVPTTAAAESAPELPLSPAAARTDDGQTRIARPRYQGHVGARAARRALRRKLAAIALLLGVSVAVVGTRAVWAGMRSLAAGDAAMGRNDVREAIAQWRRAARWYLPGASYVDVAYERLTQLAHQAQDRDDTDTALAAWRAVRGSILATRSFYTPHADRLEPANRRIAQLMAESREAPAPGGSGKATGNVLHRPVQWHYELLSRTVRPSLLWSLVTLFGFALWLGGGLLFVLRGVTAGDKLVPRTAAYAAILVAMGLMSWMLGLYLA